MGGPETYPVRAVLTVTSIDVSRQTRQSLLAIGCFGQAKLPYVGLAMCGITLKCVI